jgi:uncharacterized membrane protein YeaQ/YmgE (transglycosylase-associated protein family)
MITPSDVIVWLIVGGLAGAFTGMLVRRKKEGFGPWTNLVVGLVGALVGGGLFRLFKIDLGLEKLSVSLEDLLAAFAGSLLVLLVLWLVRRARQRNS